MNHKESMMPPEMYLRTLGPPSSPPMKGKKRRKMSMTMQEDPKATKRVTFSSMPSGRSSKYVFPVEA